MYKLEINRVKIERDKLILKYDLQVKEGSVLGIQGLSGVGKSTLLHLIAGFISPSAGDILWDGTSLLPLSVESRPVSFLFQDHNLFEHLTVRQNIGLGFGDTVPWDELMEACVYLNVDDQLKKNPGQLSGGQRQRIALIRTMLRPEPLVLLDEPFAELDAATRAIAARWTRDTATRLGKTMLLVTHQSEDIEQVSDSSLTL